MKTYFLTYADDRFGYRGGVFRERQNTLSEAALKYGADVAVRKTWEDMVQTDFYRQNKAFLDKNHFHTGYAFKPFMILQTLETMQPNDVLFYHDCNPHPLTMSMKPLVDLCVRNRGTVFMQWGDQNRNWVKRDAFYYMNCDTPRYHNAVGLQASWMLIQKRDFTVGFVREWLKYNMDERIASYVKPDTCGLPPLEGFIENRGDQAIISVLVEKLKIRSFYGQGAEPNRNVNNFILSIPHNPWQAIYWKVVELRRKRRRRKHLEYYFGLNKVNYLRGDLPKHLRESPYLPETPPPSEGA
jgi:hypothetical protein